MTRMTYGITVLAAVATVLASPLAAQETPRTVLIRTAPTAWIGLTYDAADDADGVRVRQVQDGSPAARAGIRPDDLILRLNGFRATTRSMRTLTTMLEPGDTVQLTLRRGQRTMELAVVAEARPDARTAGDGHVFEMEMGRVLEGMMDSLRVHLDTIRARVRSLPDIRIILESGDTAGFEFTTPDGQRVIRTPRMIFINPDGDTTRLPYFRWEPGDTSQFWSSFRFRDGDWTGFESAPFGPFGDSTWFRFRGDSAAFGDGRGWVSAFGSDAPVFTSFDRGARAVAGAELIALEPGLARHIRGTDEGLLVLRVGPETPAARAGLVAGDVILDAEGRQVADIAALRRIVAGADGPVRLTVLRNGGRQEIRLPRSR